MLRNAISPGQSGVWRALGGKLKVTQLSSTGYLGQFDFCAIARLTSSPTFALRDSGGGFPLVGDG
ncbi:hypothetical protein D3G89_26770 [Escherichia coli]|nr:hypothetical protein [Escherichia coli]